MAITTKARRQVGPARLTSLNVFERPVYRCTMLPEGHAGLIELNGQVYGLQCLGHGPEEGYRFWKPSGEVYDVDTSGTDPLCDCPDCTFREHVCKHGLALIQLRKQGVV